MTLAVRAGAALTPSIPVIDTFEVASDAEFSHLVATMDVVEPDVPQVSVTLGLLTPATTYYWRVRSRAADTTTPFSPTASFSVGPAETLAAPTPIEQPFQSLRPTLTVTNAARTTPTNALSYQFDVATSSDFSPVVVTGSVAEGTGQTSFVAGADLPSGATLFWRARAVDATRGIASPFSAPSRFAVVSLTAPTPVLPLDGVGQEVLAPPLVVQNVGGVRPATGVVYRFEIGTNPGIDPATETGTRNEGFTQTEYALSRPLAAGTTYYWRAQAVDSNSGVRGPFMPTQRFTTVAIGTSTLVVAVAPPCLQIAGQLSVPVIVNVSANAVIGLQAIPRGPWDNLRLTIAHAVTGWSGTIFGHFNKIGYADNNDGTALFREFGINGPLGTQSRPPTPETVVVPLYAVKQTEELSGRFDANLSIWNTFGDGGGLRDCPGVSWTFKRR